MKDLDENGLTKEQKNRIFERTRCHRIATTIRDAYTDKERCAEEAWLAAELASAPVTVCPPVKWHGGSHKADVRLLN